MHHFQEIAVAKLRTAMDPAGAARNCSKAPSPPIHPHKDAQMRVRERKNCKHMAAHESQPYPDMEANI